MKNTPHGLHRFTSKIAWLFSCVALLLIYTAASLSPISLAAAPVTMKIATPTSTVANGSTISLTIQVDAGTNQITAAQACLMYDTSKLTLINTDSSSSTLPSVTPGSSTDCSVGQAQISRFAFSPNAKTVNPASGTFSLAVVTFQAKQSGTTATISFDTAKSYIKDTATTTTNGNYSNILAGTSGVTLTLNSLTATSNISKEQPSLTDRTHTVTKSSPVSTLGQVASEDARPSAPLQPLGIKPAIKRSTTHTKVYVLSGLAIVVLMCTALLIIFSGVPGLSAINSHIEDSKYIQTEVRHTKKLILLYVGVLAAIGVYTLIVTSATTTGVVKRSSNSLSNTTNSKTYSTGRATSINDTDTLAPSIVITAPFNTTTIGNNYTVSVNARDVEGVRKVEFSVDEGRIIATSTQVPYDFVLNTKKLSNAAHRITATAFDGANNTTSVTVNVIINNTHTSDKNCNFNSDTVVDTSDLAMLLANFNKTVSINTKGDCSNNGKVDADDLFLLLGLFSK